IENLIKSGALDIIDINGYETRRGMLEKLEQAMQEAASIRQKKSSDEFELPLLFNTEPDDNNFSEFNNIIFSDDISKIQYNQYNKKEILAYEKEAIGFYISGHPLDGYEEKIQLITDYSISSLIKECILNTYKNNTENIGKNLKYSQNDKKKYILCGVINQLKIHNTKNNEKMASFILSDTDVSVEAVFFPKNYIKYENIFNTSEPVVISGRIDETALKEDFLSSNNKNSYEDSENEDKNSKSFIENSDFDAHDYNVKIIGETIDFLDSYIIKNNKILKNMPNKNNNLCVIEISSQNIYDKDKEELKNFIKRLKTGFINCSGTSKVLIKARNIEIRLNEDILVDIEALKKTDIAQNIKII
ncbi:MAG: OB-fold nucleic acid binding domain-containing protein, partial [bacterium]